MKEARTTYVGNIPNGISEEELVEWFSCVERPVKVKLCGDGTKPTQFAFVEFPSVYSAHGAIGITGTECCGFPLKISQARGTIQTPSALSLDGPAVSQEELEIRGRTVYINQLDTVLTEPYLREWFGERCGAIRQIKLCGDQSQTTRYCFIEFDTLEGANNCKGLAGTSLGNYQFKCSDSKVTLSKPIPVTGDGAASAQQSRTVHIANLDRAITENDLRAYFEQCGTVCHVYIVAGETHQPVRYGFVEFIDIGSVPKAFALSGAVIGQYGIRVSQAKGVITSGATKASATLPGLPAPNTAQQEAMNAAYAAALQAENLKYQQYIARKQIGGGDDSDDSRKRKRRRRRRSRSSSSDRGRRRKRHSRSRSRGR